MSSLKEILAVLSEAASNAGTTAYICGGTPRDKVMGNLSNIEDLDITTGDNKIQFIAKEASIKLGGNFKQMNDGHSQLYLDGFKVDFSSNYTLPNLVPTLQQAGLKNPSSMQLELYSRDFTCNAMLMTLDLKKVIDPIGLGLNDIKKKRLRTCMPAHMTLGNDHKRVARVIYMAAKLGFYLDEEIVNWVKKHPESLVSPHQNYVVDKLQEAFNYNPQVSTNILNQLGLWKYVPPSDKLTPYLTQGAGRL
jgi:tRNA nucleotidyltransferase/poly(A) polymerase